MDVNGRLVEVQRRISRQMVDPNRKPLPTRPQNITRRLGKVTSVNFVSGRCQVEMNTKLIDGVPWYDFYCPRINDFVWVQFQGGKEPIIIGTEHAGTGSPQRDKWNIVGQAGQPSFTNNWVNYGQGWSSAKFRRVGELVVVAGHLKNGNLGGSAFVLPVGFRPYENYFLATMADPGVPVGSNNGAFFVDNGGNVVPYVGGNVSFSIACCFVAEQ